MISIISSNSIAFVFVEEEEEGNERRGERSARVVSAALRWRWIEVNLIRSLAQTAAPCPNRVNESQHSGG